MYTAEEENAIAVSCFEEFTAETKKNLLWVFTERGDFENKEKKLIKTLSHGVYNKVRSAFFSESYRAEILRGLEEKGIKCVTLFSKGYPSLLAETDNPPLVLFCRGDTSLLQSRCFSIVGSRRSTPYALGLCKKIAADISGAFTVVTGTAEGADTAAAEGALEAGGRIICVLAGGLDRIYPASNYNLLNKIASNGLLVSEHPPEVAAQKYFFPVRNRILAGLSRGTLVVSAGKKSGALITADYAVEYGRSVFAVPYSVGVASGEGCNALIKKGAVLTENMLDIFSEFGLDFNTPQVSLTEDEQTVYNEIKAQGEAFLPAVAAKLNMPLHLVITVAMSLVIKKMAVSLGGNRYNAIN